GGRPQRGGGGRAESCHCSSPETPIHGRSVGQPPPMAPQICARWPGGRRHSKEPAARRADSFAPGLSCPGQTMKAFIIDRYGSGARMRAREMPDPVMREDDVLVQIHAAGVNVLDSKIRQGEI